MKGVGILALKCLGLELTGATSVHISLAGTSHKSPVDMPGDRDGEPVPQLTHQECSLSLSH